MSSTRQSKKIFKGLELRLVSCFYAAVCFVGVGVVCAATVTETLGDASPIFIVVEGENFGNGWCILPVLVASERHVRKAYGNGYKDYPDMGPLYSAGRYRYSGTKLTGLNAVSDIEFSEVGGYVLWARSKFYAGENKGTYVVQIDSWQSQEFGGESVSDVWKWQKDIITIDKTGTKMIRLNETRPEACCDVLILTTDKDYYPTGNQVPRPGDRGRKVIAIDWHECPEAINENTKVFQFAHGIPTSYHAYFGDCDGDGKDDIILPFEDEHIEAFKYDGTSLWTCDASFPWQFVNKGNYQELGYKYFIPHDFRPNPRIGYHIIDYHPVADIDGNGEEEFIFGWNPMYIIDPGTGTITYERMLDGQAARMDIADLYGDGEKSEIVVVTDDAVSGRAYVHALDNQLNTIWQTRVDGADIEHYVAVGDIDADGKNEIAFTASSNLHCIDNDGTPLWVIKGSDNWRGFANHTDMLIIDSIDGDPSNGNELVLCEGTVFNKDGTMRFHIGQDWDHGQHCTVGKIRDDYAGKQLIFGERNIGNVYCCSGNGAMLWKRGRYHGERVHASDTFLINWSGRGKKEILCRYLGIFDEYGNLIKVPPYVRSGSSDLQVADVIGDERDEIIVTPGRTTYVIVNTGAYTEVTDEKISSSDEKSGGRVRRKSAKMLDSQRIDVFLGLSDSNVGRVYGQRR